MVLDEQDRERPLVAQPHDEVAELLDLLVVEPAGRLVEQQERGLRHQRARDLDALLGSVRQRRGRHAGPARQPDDVERLERVPLPDPPTERVPADEDVLEDGHRTEQVDVLERPGDAPPHDLVRRGAQQRRAVELDLAGIRRVEPRDDVEHRRLARAVRADQARHDAPVDVEGDAVQSHDAAEPQRDVPHREQHRAQDPRGSL